MRSLCFVPLTYLAGVHGFALFAPYLALFFAAVLILRRRRIRLAVRAARHEARIVLARPAEFALRTPILVPIPAV